MCLSYKLLAFSPKTQKQGVEVNLGFHFICVVIYWLFLCIRSGVQHSKLRQVGEGLSVSSGAGAPVAKAVYRGGECSV